MTPPSIEAQPGENRLRIEGEQTEPPQRHSIWRDAVLALSVANFCFIQAWHGLLFKRDYGYFNRIPINRASLAALLINVFALALLVWLVCRCVRRLNRRALWALADIALCAAILVPLNFVRTHFWHLTGGKFVSVAKEPVVLAAAVVALLGIFWVHRYAARVVAAVYMIFSPMVLFTGGRAAWWLLQPPSPPAETRAPVTPPKISGPRVVWILLDELDERIAFQERPADIALPELTRFYNECFRATNAFPPGGSTLYSLPALTIGHEVRRAHPSGAGELSFNGTARWSEADTIFSRARSLGFSTTLVGWYHPYSRILGHDLEHCEWFPYPPFEEERGHTIGEAAVNQLCSIVSQFQQRRLHIRNVDAARSRSLQFLTNSPAGLTLLHLPLPHLPGIYDPKHERLTLWQYSRNRGYLQNLVLADQLFGKLRRAMESVGTWEDAWVLLSSDHCWRDAARYDGKTDHRVPFIIKAPGKNQSVTYSSRFNTVVTYQLILSILKGELTDSTQLPQWLDTFRTDPPASYTLDGEPF